MVAIRLVFAYTQKNQLPHLLPITDKWYNKISDALVMNKNFLTVQIARKGARCHSLFSQRTKVDQLVNETLNITR